jgi:hypothetical protein
MIVTNSNVIKSTGAVNNCQSGFAVLRLWEIAPYFKCPVIGLCLTPAEQKQLLKKANMPWKDKNPFQIHEMLVAGTENENRLSRKVDHLLTRKFERQAEPMRQLPEQTFIQHWRSCFKSGQYMAVFWAAASRADLSTEAKRDIYGAIHMSMHANAEQDFQAKRLLEQSQKKLSEKSSKILILKQRYKDLQNKNEMLSRAQIMLEAKLLSMSKKKNELNGSLEALKAQSRIVDLETENQHLKTALSDKTEQFQSIERELKLFEKRSTALAKDLESQTQANMQLKTEAQEAIRLFIDANRCDPDCPAFDLCRKRVLIVGGIERMESLYRQLIEGKGGTFDYHDGCLNGGSKQLENSLKRADIVLCPINCNSHAACSLVKNLGKKHSKPVHIMTNFSLNAVSKTLGKMASTN